RSPRDSSHQAWTTLSHDHIRPPPELRQSLANGDRPAPGPRVLTVSSRTSRAASRRSPPGMLIASGETSPGETQNECRLTPLRKGAPGSCRWECMAGGHVLRVTCRQGLARLCPGGYVDAVMVRPRESADHAAAREFLARHDSLRVARLGELAHPL